MMKKRACWYLSFVLTLLMVFMTLPMVAAAETYEDLNLSDTVPIIDNSEMRNGNVRVEEDAPAKNTIPVETEEVRPEDTLENDLTADAEAVKPDMEPWENECAVEEEDERIEVADIQETDCEFGIESDEVPSRPADDPMTPDELDEAAEPDMEEVDSEEPNKPEIPCPDIRLVASFDGETLTEGMVVTITATVEGIPEGMKYSVRWRNNMSGEFRDVPGETGMNVRFVADERNVNCVWQLALTLVAPNDE